MHEDCVTCGRVGTNASPIKHLDNNYYFTVDMHEDGQKLTIIF